MYFFIYNIIILIVLCSFCEAARILAVFPTPSISHQVVFRPLTRELAARGHEVVIITTDPFYPNGETPPNLIEIDVHDISYKLWRKAILSSATTSGRSYDTVSQRWTMLPLLSKIFEIQFQTEQVKQIMNNNTYSFDLILVEACVRPAVAVSHVFKVPVVYVSSFLGAIRNYDVMGAPMRPPLLYPSVLRQRIHNMSLWEKIVELYRYYRFQRVFDYVEAEDNKRIKRMFGKDTPTLSELENNVQLMLLNSHPIWDMNRPVPPSIIYMGGMHQKPPKELPRDLKSYLDSSKNGVIYISFGTNVDPAVLPAERIQMLVKAFSKLPYDVLWKWSKDELPGRTPNIRISKWLPQSDLLKHPNIKLFITQGGLQSTDEAITAGVPLIGMPMFMDQWYNVEQYLIHRIGLRKDLEHLTEEEFLKAIYTIINDDSYRKNIIKLRNIMRDQPQQPLDRAIWWVEHLLRHGGARHLRPRVANMSWAEYLDIELVTVLGLALVCVLGAIIIALYLVVGEVKKKSTGSKLKRS